MSGRATAPASHFTLFAPQGRSNSSHGFLTHGKDCHRFSRTTLTGSTNDHRQTAPCAISGPVERRPISLLFGGLRIPGHAGRLTVYPFRGYGCVISVAYTTPCCQGPHVLIHHGWNRLNGHFLDATGRQYFEDFRGLLYALSFETGLQEGLELWRRANKRFYGAGFLAVAQWHDEQGFKKD